MLNEHTLTQLRSLRLDGMVRAIEEQASNTAISTAAAGLSFDERLTLLVQREVAWREDRRVQRLLKAAKLKVSSACIEDINWRASRALDRGLITTLAGGDWLRHARNLLITGATGSGKTWLACALAHQAARSGLSVLYVRAARLFDELQVAHGDGSFARRLAQLAKLDLIVIDDFAGLSHRRGRAQRPARTAGRPHRHAFDLDHQPAAGQGLAHLPQRPDTGRRHPRPRRALKPQDRAQGHPLDARQRCCGSDVNRPPARPAHAAGPDMSTWPGRGASGGLAGA